MTYHIAKRISKYVMVLYVVQALIGIGVGIYFASTLDPIEIERMVSCVAY